MNSASAIKAAEVALNKGDYNNCLKLIEPLFSKHSETSEIGSQLRLFAVTAHMGNGEEQKAIHICRLLIKSKKSIIREQAKQLLTILEAPSLPRPSNWSVKIPKLEMKPSTASSFRKGQKETKKANHPPTGPTKNPDLGFSILTVVIILLLTFLLSGCVDIATNINVTGSDRLNFSLNVNSNSGKSIPWQLDFIENLKKEKSILKVSTEENNSHVFIESPTVRFQEANRLFKLVTKSASNASGLDISYPQINVDNKNWLIGTKQYLDFHFDLSELPKIPGLKINMTINSFKNNANYKSNSFHPIFKNRSISLPLQEGEINQIEFSSWRWNKILIGFLLIISLTLLSILLQKLRLKMGFGFPELPP